MDVSKEGGVRNECVKGVKGEVKGIFKERFKEHVELIPTMDAS